MSQRLQTPAANPVIGTDEDGQPVPKFVSDELRPDIAAELLKEYHDRLRQLIARALRLRADAAGGLLTRTRPKPDPEREEVRDHIKRLLPAVTELARYASGLVEQARIRPYERLEVRLRQAELESALTTATEVVKLI